MTYIVPTLDITQKINPFTLFGGTPLNRDSLMSYIEKGDIFNHSGDTHDVVHMKKIAFEYINFVDKPITLESNQVIDNPHYYVACVLKNQKNIYVDGTDFTNYPTVSMDYLDDNTYRSFNWDIGGKLHAWDNHEYIISQLNKTDSQKVKACVAPEVWSDIEFVKKLYITCPSVAKQYSSSTLKSVEFIENIKNDASLLPILWGSLYKDLTDHNKTYAYDEKLDQIFKQHIFNDIGVVKQFIKFDNNIYHKLSSELKMEPELINSWLSKNSQQALWVLPEEFFKDIQNFKNILPQSDINLVKHYTFKPWIDSKDKILELFEGGISPKISSFFQHLGKELGKDKTILNLFLKANLDTYRQFSKSQRTKEIVQNFIDWGGDISQIENEAFKLTETKHIKKVVEKHAHLLGLENCPPRWLEDDIILCASKSLQFSGLSKERLEKFLDVAENLDYVKSVNTQIYSQIPDKYRCDIEWSKRYLESLSNHNLSETRAVFDSSQGLFRIPKQVWSNRDFCLNALRKSVLCSTFVPVEFFKDKKFIQNVFSDIDNKTISKELIKYMPLDIKKTLEDHEITENYSKFIKDFVLINSLEQDLEQKAYTKKIKI